MTTMALAVVAGGVLPATFVRAQAAAASPASLPPAMTLPDHATEAVLPSVSANPKSSSTIAAAVEAAAAARDTAAAAQQPTGTPRIPACLLPLSW